MVWSFAGANACSDAQRLPNGNTLVVGYFEKVMHEVDHTGKSVGQFALVTPSRSVRRLLDGRTITGRDNSVSIFGAKGKRVAQIRLKADAFVGSLQIY